MKRNSGKVARAKMQASSLPPARDKQILPGGGRDETELTPPLFRTETRISAVYECRGAPRDQQIAYSRSLLKHVAMKYVQVEACL